MLTCSFSVVTLSVSFTGLFLTRAAFLTPVSSSMDMSSSSGVVAVEDRSALSSQLSAGAGAGLPGPLPVTGAGAGAALPWSTCIWTSGAASGVLTAGGGAPQEGTNEGALTLRASILLLTSMPSSQLSGAPLVAISGSVS